jgi:hypothetical protein
MGIASTDSHLRLLNKTPCHPDRKAIEAQFGKVFAPVQDGWRRWFGVNQPKIEQAVVVTSLIPRACRQQSAAVNSWHNHGFEVVSVNTPEEIETTRFLYPQVDRWIAESDLPPHYGKKTQWIHRLIQVSLELSKDVWIINSDCLLIGDQSITRAAMSRGPAIIPRFNYERSLDDAEQEQWGLDAFYLPKDLAAQIPETCYAIGIPFWDYWLAWWLEQRRRISWVGAKILYHKSHPLRWSTEEWLFGRDWFQATYGVHVNWEEWRRSKPLYTEQKAL